MRLLIVVVLLALAAWRAWIDWQATIGEGYAYRLTTIDQSLSHAFPEAHAELISAWQGVSPGWLWNPLGTTFLGLPLAMVLALLAALIWATRRRARGRG
jgi:hypothetical protein